MTRRLLTLTVDGGIVVARGWKASGILRCAGMRPTYSGTAGGWMLDTARLPELLAWLDDRRMAYAIEGDRPVSASDAPESAAIVPEPEPEATLW